MAAKPPPFEPGFARRAQAAPGTRPEPGKGRAERAERAEYVIDPPAPAWLNAGFAVQAIGQSGQIGMPAGGYAPCQGPRPGLAFDLRA